MSWIKEVNVAHLFIKKKPSLFEAASFVLF